MIYRPDAPTLLQANAWACLTTSLRWAAQSLGRPTVRRDVERLVLRQQVITPHGNLVDKTGLALAQFAREELAVVTSYRDVTRWEEVTSQAGQWPLVLGGWGWQHYAAVRDYDPLADLLLLANPVARPWRGVGQTMARHQFDRLHPLVLIRVAPEGSQDVSPLRPGHRPAGGHAGPDLPDGVNPDRSAGRLLHQL